MSRLRSTLSGSTASARLAAAALAAAALALAACGEPTSLGIGNFDNNNVPDVAVTIADIDPDFVDQDAVAILLGKANGTFTTKPNLDAGSDPAGVAVGRFAVRNRQLTGPYQTVLKAGSVSIGSNATARSNARDLAVANAGSDDVSIFLGTGKGAFTAKPDVPTGEKPVAIAVADFDADGAADPVTANQDGDSVSVLRGNGDGTFKAKRDSAAGGSPAGLAVGDLNGDGRADLVVSLPEDDAVAVLLGNGDGTFQSPQIVPVGDMPVAVGLVDLTRDGRQDVVVGNSGDDDLSILRNTGSGFSALADVPVGDMPLALVTGLFNKDRFGDLAVVNTGSDTASVLYGKGDGTFQPRTDFATGDMPVAIGADYMTPNFAGRDETIDLVVVNKGSGTVSVLRATPDGKSFLSKTDTDVPNSGDLSEEDACEILEDLIGVDVCDILGGGGGPTIGGPTGGPTTGGPTIGGPTIGGPTVGTVAGPPLP